jgi:hypothetical protein
MRSFRSAQVSAFVKAVLDCDTTSARALLTEFEARYPIVVSRDITQAKKWVRDQARGSERYGLVASSGAQAPSNLTRSTSVTQSILSTGS